MSDTAQFVAHFHPVVLHLPIGAYLGLIAAEALRWLRPNWHLEPTCWFLLTMGVITAIPTVITGLSFAPDDYRAASYLWHKWLGLTMVGLGPLCLLARWRWRKIYAGLLLLLLATLLLGAHHGGEMTHGSGFLTKHAPWANQANQANQASEPPGGDEDPDTTTTGQDENDQPPPPNGDPQPERVAFDHDIVPILKKRCYECHGPDKQKGDLRLDTIAHIRSAAVVVPGKPAESSLYTLTILDPDDPDIMPSKGKPLTPAQTDLLKRWINEGADFGDGKPLTAPTAGGSTVPTADELDLAAAQLPPADREAITALEKAGIRVFALTDNRGLIEIDAARAELDATFWQHLATLAPQVAWLNLRDTKLADANLAVLRNAANLRRCHLERTAITGKALAHLETCTQLRYLNCYRTKVDDAGLRHLQGLKKLETLYLWQTEVTAEGITALEKSLPQVRVHRH